MVRLELGEISVDVIQKDIKNVHLSVFPPTGSVRIAAPLRMNLETIRVFAISKLAWIRQQQQKLQQQERETEREYLSRESHYLWGQRYLLEIVEHAAAPVIELRHHVMVLKLRPNTAASSKAAIMAKWYREQLKAAVFPIIAKWEPVLGVKVRQLFVQHMKTRWGSCNATVGNIRLNSELTKKPREFLEYVVLHEMVHLLEPTHNRRFMALMDQFMPNWRFERQKLNALPLRHEHWQS
jgi:predicted metal-dependent hydrolase